MWRVMWRERARFGLDIEAQIIDNRARSDYGNYEAVDP